MQIEKVDGENGTSVVRLTQMHAIMYYLGENFHMLGKTADEKARVIMIIEAGRDWINSLFDVTYCNAPWYKDNEDGVHVSGNKQCTITSPKFEAMKEEYLSKTLKIYANRFVQLLNKRSDNLRWIANTIEPTIADYILFEYIDQHYILCPKCLPNDLIEYRKQFLNLESIQLYRNSHRYREEPLHNRYSHFHEGWVEKSKAMENGEQKDFNNNNNSKTMKDKRDAVFFLAPPSENHDLAVHALYNNAETMLPHLKVLMGMDMEAMKNRRLIHRNGFINGASKFYDIMAKINKEIILIGTTGFRIVDMEEGFAEWGIVVDKNWRNLGVCTRMYSLCIEKAKKIGLKRVTASTLIENDVMANFLIKNGMNKTGNMHEGGWVEYEVYIAPSF